MHKTGNQYKRKQQIDSQRSYTHSKSKQNTEPVLHSYGRGTYFCKSRLKSKWMYQLKKKKKKKSSSKCKLLGLKLINKINIIVNRVKTERYPPPPPTNDYIPGQERWKEDQNVTTRSPGGRYFPWEFCTGHTAKHKLNIKNIHPHAIWKTNTEHTTAS